MRKLDEIYVGVSHVMYDTNGNRINGTYYRYYLTDENKKHIKDIMLQLIEPYKGHTNDADAVVEGLIQEIEAL